jgi:hypothetical protein
MRSQLRRDRWRQQQMLGSESGQVENQAWTVSEQLVSVVCMVVLSGVVHLSHGRLDPA